MSIPAKRMNVKSFSLEISIIQNMCNFDKQNDDTKLLIHLFMKKSADALGGINFLLKLIESMKEQKPNALIYKSRCIKSDEATIEWNKTVFKDKFDVLEDIIRFHKSLEETHCNILENKGTKKAKKILNMVRTLAPIKFTITPLGHSEDDELSFKVFDNIEDNFASLNPIFVAMFFCSTEFTKKALKYNQA